MRLFIVENNEGDWDQLESAAIYAESEEEAKSIWIACANKVADPPEDIDLEVTEVDIQKGIVHTHIKWG